MPSPHLVEFTIWTCPLSTTPNSVCTPSNPAIGKSPISINPATNYVVLRASSHAFIKACLAGKGDSLGQGHNTEQEQA
jgi:hypothetical protein